MLSRGEIPSSDDESDDEIMEIVRDEGVVEGEGSIRNVEDESFNEETVEEEKTEDAIIQVTMTDEVEELPLVLDEGPSSTNDEEHQPRRMESGVITADEFGGYFRNSETMHLAYAVLIISVLAALIVTCRYFFLV